MFMDEVELNTGFGDKICAGWGVGGDMLCFMKLFD